MFRFFAICLVLAIGCVTAVVFGSKYVFPDLERTTNPDDSNKKEVRAERGGESDSRPAPEEKPVKFEKMVGRPRATQTLILADGRVLPAEQVDVASDRSGSLVFLATKAHDREYVPASKLIVKSMTYLAVEARPGEVIRDDEKLPDPTGSGKSYRQARPTDILESGKTAIVTIPVRFRKLAEDDEVMEGDILGVIRPDLAVNDLQVKQAKVRQSKQDHIASIKITEEMARQYKVSKGLFERGSEKKDELYKTEVQLAKARAEELSKEAGIDVSRAEMEGSWRTLNLYTIRAPIGGTIRTLFKQPGEAVKELDQVLQLQNTRRLRVQTQVEVQDALPLRQRIDQARTLRDKANDIARKATGPQAEDDAKKLREQADKLVAVEIEASRPQPPLAVLRGHLQDVTCVAVSRGPDSLIISGSVEGIVRIWKRVPGEDRWEEFAKLNHRAAIRALACTSSKEKNLLLTATSNGRVRIFNLDDLEAGEQLMPEQHKGPINAAAFNAEGTQAATGGEDRAIMLWNVADKSLLLRRSNAHQAPITSLAFTPDGQLVSAGRDRGLFVWTLDAGNGDEKVLKRTSEIPGRSGDVTQLGLDPKGQYTLLDEGRELRVVALEDQHLEGSLANSSASGSFSTFALFSPDGKSILTNGAAAGRLQLWRAPSNQVRAAELRQFLWSSGTVNCAAFDPSPAPEFAVTGTSDGKVLVWKMPTTKEASSTIRGELSYVEGFLDTSNKRVTIRATFDNADGWVLPGAAASIVVPPPPAK